MYILHIDPLIIPNIKYVQRNLFNIKINLLFLTINICILFYNQLIFIHFIYIDKNILNVCQTIAHTANIYPNLIK